MQLHPNFICFNSLSIAYYMYTIRWTFFGSLRKDRMGKKRVPTDKWGQRAVAMCVFYGSEHTYVMTLAFCSCSNNYRRILCPIGEKYHFFCVISSCRRKTDSSLNILIIAYHCDIEWVRLAELWIYETSWNQLVEILDSRINCPAQFGCKSHRILNAIHI